MSRVNRKWDLRLGLLAGLVMTAGCEDMLLNDPAPAVAGLAVSYTLDETAGAAEGPLADHVPLDGARVRVFGEDESVLDEETMDLGSPGEETRVQLVVPMEEDVRTVRVAVELLSHGEVVASGSAVAAVERGTTTEVGVQVGVDNCSLQSQIPAVECRALITLYNSTNGPEWTNSTGWLSDTPCSWFGVTCSGGRVTVLFFSENGLSGPIPPEVENLSSLTLIRLEFNQLTGSIPAELGNLTSLEALRLDGNPLTGAIPAELGNLSSLTTLLAEQTQLSSQVPIEVALLGGRIGHRCKLTHSAGLFMPDTQEYREADLDDDGAICQLTLGA